MRKSEKPRVSIIMAVYREPLEWVVQAVESILGQTMQDYEFIIINDGEYSENYQYLMEISKTDDRICVISNDENAGLTKCLNKGLAAAKGEFIARMDADDICRKDRLKEQLSFMEANTDIAAVGAYAETFGDGVKRCIIGLGCGKNNEETRVRMFFCNAGPVHSSAFIRKDFLDVYGITYNEKWKKSQDYGLWTDILLCGGQLSVMNKVLMKYRIHGGQISQIKREEQAFYFKQIQYAFISRSFKSIKISDKEMECQMHLSMPDGEGSMTEIGRYIEKIIRKNKETKIFCPQQFESELYKRLLKQIVKRVSKTRKWDFLKVKNWKSVFRIGVLRSILEDFAEMNRWRMIRILNETSWK